MRIEALDYDLPHELIAQRPLKDRDESRLMVVKCGTLGIGERRFADLPELLDSKDLLVVNESGVRRARVMARKQSGGRVELLLCERMDGEWKALVRGSRLRPGLRLRAETDGTGIRLQSRQEGGAWKVKTSIDDGWLSRNGRVPLPPYIHEEFDGAADRYQPVYASRPGSAAAPTAGLHFSARLMCRLERANIRMKRLSLHVGPGTFHHLRKLRVEDHRMDSEPFQIPAETAHAIALTREAGGRVVAVGTSTARALESACLEDGECTAKSGRSSLFIYPGYDFRCVDALLTNFHQPRTPPLAMVYALGGESIVRRAYRQAIESGFRLLSFGDAMLVLP